MKTRIIFGTKKYTLKRFFLRQHNTILNIWKTEFISVCCVVECVFSDISNHPLYKIQQWQASEFANGKLHHTHTVFTNFTNSYNILSSSADVTINVIYTKNNYLHVVATRHSWFRRSNYWREYVGKTEKPIF